MTAQFEIQVKEGTSQPIFTASFGVQKSQCLGWLDFCLSVFGFKPGYWFFRILKIQIIYNGSKQRRCH